MTKEATINAALNLALDFIVATNKSSSFWLVPGSNLNKTVTSIKEALAPTSTQCEKQPAQEPVGSLNITSYKGLGNYDFDYVGKLPDGTYSVYTTPPQEQQSCDKRTWVGLTDEEAEDIVESCDGVGWDVAQVIRKKLKEKNT
jgi:hypothetical protein